MFFLTAAGSGAAASGPLDRFGGRRDNPAIDRTCDMFSNLKALWARLAGGPAGGGAQPAIEAVEYKGYRIRPAPYLAGSQYQTAGSIEKDTPEGLKQHNFIRADTYASREDAIAFTVSKAKQMIDLQGERMFG
jgi:hypothetical protein